MTPPTMSQPESPHRTPSWWTLVLLVGTVWAGSQALQWWQDQRQQQALVEVLAQHPVQAGDVLMYTTSTCPYCAKARAWLNTHQVPFTECNVEREAHCQAEFERMGSPGVPLMNVKGQWRLGFDAPWFTLALQRRQADKPKMDSSPRP